jgi:endonuclease I
MGNLMFSICLFLTTLSFSQIPSGYYNTTIGLSGDSLKSDLHNIIKDHTEFPYTSSNTDVWDILKQTDKDPNDSSKVILLYTGWSLDASQEYNSGKGWSREHVWSKSHGDFGTTKGAGTDVHHLRPADVTVNTAKNNRWFDTCSTSYIDNGVVTGSYTSSTDWVWQLRDEVKGDVARMILYMATRYEGDNGEPDLEIVDYIPTKSTNDSVYAKLSTLLQWHKEDTVDAWERRRNDIIYYSYQNNRNPFIDHPEYAELIWASVVTSTRQDQAEEIKVYPNPVRDYFRIDVKGDIEKVEVLDDSGRQVMLLRGVLSGQNINLTKLPHGVYIIKAYTAVGIFSSRIMKEE